ncbi:MAG TPA: hypothetical protein VHH34_00420 [Pseudonocardiaceae bacterium]|nr:hypothetical protein [Pseudonocardiaceae bacterium]
MIPSPAEPSLALVLASGSDTSRHTSGPEQIAFAAARLASPSCRGWTFHAALIEPDAIGGEQHG